MIDEKRLALIKKRLKNYPAFEFLAKGKRGEVYKLSRDLVAKIERDDISAKDTAKNEYEILKKLEKYPYFPKPEFYDKDLRFLVREYVKGENIDKTLDKAIFFEVLKLARALDIEMINQQELTNPYKHIFFFKKKVMMIDFEKARISKKPKNVTQFSQYIFARFKINPKLIEVKLRKYKKSNSGKDFETIIKVLKELMQ